VNLTYDSVHHREEAIAAGGIPAVVQLLTVGDNTGRLNAAKALINLSLGSKDNKAAMVKAKAIQPLVALLKHSLASKDGQGKTPARALRNLAFDADSKAEVAARAVKPLVQLLREGDPQSKVQAAAALQAVAVNNTLMLTNLVNAGAIPALVDLLRYGTPDGRKMAAGALYNLTASDSNSRAVKKECGYTRAQLRELHSQKPRKMRGLGLEGKLKGSLSMSRERAEGCDAEGAPAKPNPTPSIPRAPPAGGTSDRGLAIEGKLKEPFSTAGERDAEGKELEQGLIPTKQLQASREGPLVTSPSYLSSGSTAATTPATPRSGPASDSAVRTSPQSTAGSLVERMRERFEQQ
jgi:hypothetical protein